MLIALYFLIVNVALPRLVALVSALGNALMPSIIVLAGIVMLFGAVGMKISHNLGATIVGGIFGGIGYLIVQLGHGIRWIITQIWRLIPRVFHGSRNTFQRMGANGVASNLLAVLVTLVVIAIII